MQDFRKFREFVRREIRVFFRSVWAVGAGFREREQRKIQTESEQVGIHTQFTLLEFWDTKASLMIGKKFKIQSFRLN